MFFYQLCLSWTRFFLFKRCRCACICKIYSPFASPQHSGFIFYFSRRVKPHSLFPLFVCIRSQTCFSFLFFRHLLFNKLRSVELTFHAFSFCWKMATQIFTPQPANECKQVEKGVATWYTSLYFFYIYTFYWYPLWVCVTGCAMLCTVHKTCWQQSNEIRLDAVECVEMCFTTKALFHTAFHCLSMLWFSSFSVYIC